MSDCAINWKPRPQRGTGVTETIGAILSRQQGLAGSTALPSYFAALPVIASFPLHGNVVGGDILSK